MTQNTYIEKIAGPSPKAAKGFFDTIKNHFIKHKTAYSGFGTALAADQFTNDFDIKNIFTGEEGKGFGGHLGPGLRVGNFLVNGMVGATLPSIKNKKDMFAVASSIPVKDLALVGANKLPSAFDDFSKSVKNQEVANNIAKETAGSGGALPWVLGTLGAGALGLGGVALWKYLQKWDSTDTKAEITVPGSKGDPYSAIKVQVPMDPKDFGNKLISGVTRGVKRKLRSNIKANSKKIDPVTGKKIPYEEWVMKYGDEDEKADLGLENDGTTDQPVANPYADPNTGIKVKSASTIPGIPPPAPMPGPKQPPPPPPGKPAQSKPKAPPPDVRCRRPVPQQNRYRSAQERYPAPGGFNRALQGNSRLMTILARKNARQSGAVLPNTPMMQPGFTPTPGFGADMPPMPQSNEFYVDPVHNGPDMNKTASEYDLSARQEVSSVMDRIYKENPSAWPYGLSITGHDDVYLVRDKMTKQAAGFVGWQERNIKGRKVGSYSIGILPEYRHNGFAKEAVAKVLKIKSAGVDEVCAYVVPDNKPSMSLANSLGVTIVNNF